MRRRRYNAFPVYFARESCSSSFRRVRTDGFGYEMSVVFDCYTVTVQDVIRSYPFGSNWTHG